MLRAGIAALVPVAIGVFAAGGYGPGARVAFGIAALIGAAFTVRRDVLPQPVVVVLLALAAFGALSALWTLGPVDGTLRWALVTAGYAGVVVAAAALGRRWRGIEVIAAALAVLAVVAGLAGLVAVVAHEPPYAERIAGVWRPGGPFEYPPALALLEVSALPALLAALGARSRWVTAFGGVGLAVAGGVLALSASRVSVAMAVAVVGLAVLGGRRLSARVALPLLAVAVLIGSVAFGTSAGRGGFLHGRGSTWEAAVDTFTDQPLGGAGADAFLAGSARHQGGQTILFAHNLPLELAAELGVVGLALALALYATTARVIWRARATRAGRLLGPGAAAFLVASVVDWPWHLAGSGAIWALCVGALIPFLLQQGAPALQIQGDHS